MSDFVDLVRPLQERLSLYDRTRPPSDQPNNHTTDPARACPQGFIDAMVVREEVFVKEQKVALENEVDEDDARSFHWVVYASIPTTTTTTTNGADSTSDSSRRSSTSTKIPVGTIRLVPPPHAPHHSPDSNGDHTTPHGATGPDGQESYIKLGRLAVIKEFRKTGISKLLIGTALAFARDRPQDVDGPQPDPTSIETARHGTAASTFHGLVLVHAQVGVQKVWGEYGFERDDAMGVWDEEGIDHVGMWKRLDVSAGRSKSKTAWLSGSGAGASSNAGKEGA